MTSEELNRTIEFIVQSQARLAAAQEQDRVDRIKFEEWSTGMTNHLAELAEIQSRRLDYADNENRAAQLRFEDLFKQSGQHHADLLERSDEQHRQALQQVRELKGELIAAIDRLAQTIREQ